MRCVSKEESPMPGAHCECHRNTQGDFTMAEKSLSDGKRVLIVDDEPDVLETLKDLLPMCDVVKASSFEEAKELLQTEYFHIAHKF